MKETGGAAFLPARAAIRKWLFDGGLYFVALLELPVAVLLVVEAITRDFLSYSNPAPLELRMYAVAAGTFLAAASTYRKNMHVVLDLGLFKSGVGVAITDKWSALVSLIVVATLLYGFTAMVIASYSSGATSLTQLQTPLVIPQGLVWLGVLTFALELVLRLFQAPAPSAGSTRQLPLV